jgi:hypothetical protein
MAQQEYTLNVYVRGKAVYEDVDYVGHNPFLDD